MDASLNFGGDLTFDSTGDILLATDVQTTQQRVLRRLLTNQGDYIQHLGYGAGLGQFVGQPTAARRIQAVAQQQMKRERSLAPVPPATATVKSDQTGVYTLNIKYTDQTGQPSSITSPLGA